MKIREIIGEAVERCQNEEGEMVTILRNPSYRELKAFMKWNGDNDWHPARGIIDMNSGDIYLWNAKDGVHDEFHSQLGLSRTDSFYAYANGLGNRPYADDHEIGAFDEETAAEWHNNRNLVRLYGPDFKVEFVGDGGL